MVDAENLLKRIEELLIYTGPLPDDERYRILGEVYTGTVAIATQLWGARSPQVELVKQLREDMQNSKFLDYQKADYIVHQCHGVLDSIKSDIRDGRLGSIRFEYQGQVFADFLNLAKAALAEDNKDVGAVLAAAALEDTLKRFAEAEGLDVEDKDLSNVVNALKSESLLSATQGALLKGMVQFRNKALHARWDKLDTAEVQSVIAFVEEFLAKRFG